MAACGGSGGGGESAPPQTPAPAPPAPLAPPPPAPPARAPAETRPPNGVGQQPAFPNQTRAPQPNASHAYQIETVATGLQQPWGLEFLPDGRMLVTERPGRLRSVSADGLLSPPIAGLPPVAATGQGGLLDVALASDFAASRRVFWAYAEARGGDATALAVAGGTLSPDGAALSDVRVIFRQEPAFVSGLHFGSRLVFDRGGRMFITTGDRGQGAPAQDTANHIGKVIRINADGSVPADNPFVGLNSTRPEIWSSGHRNIQGAVLHPDTGRLWTVEHGPQGGDELNQPEPGRNYGWPLITYGVNYDGKAIGEATARAGLEQPVYYWDPVIAPGGMDFYLGGLFPEWRGSLFIAGLQQGGVVRLTF
ncbi:MAG: PQQ-dependent sugar dehydrogenase, partial [Proteobacteria bacterium]|nr:PQQ-dependent sugar dehydrogenase [Pseudomonadota bacterium]